MRSRSVEDPAWRPHKSTTGGSKVRKPVVYEGVPVSGSLSLPQRPEDGFLSDEASLLTEADAESFELLCLELFNSTGVPLAVVVSNHAGEDWETTQQLVRAELRLPDDISDSEFQLAAATSRVLVERAQHFAHAIGTRWGVGGDSNWHNGIVLVMVSFPFLPSTHIVVDAALGCAFGDIHGNNILARNIARYIIRIELYSLAAHQGPVGDSAPSLSRSAVERAIEEAELSQRLRSTATVAVRGFKQHLIDTLVGALSTSVVLPPKSAIARLTGNRKRQSKRQSKRKRDRDGDDGTPSIASRFSKGRMLPCECWGCMDAARAWGRLPPLPVQGTYFQLLSDHAQLLGYGQQATIETMARYVFPFTRIPLAVLTIRRIVNRKMGDDAFLADALAYGVGVFNAWGLGHPTWNLGVLLLVVHDDHNTEKEALQETGAAVVFGNGWTDRERNTLHGHAARLHRFMLDAASGAIGDASSRSSSSNGVESGARAAIAAQVVKTTRLLARMVSEYEPEPPSELQPEKRGSVGSAVFVSPFGGATTDADTVAVGFGSERSTCDGSTCTDAAFVTGDEEAFATAGEAASSLSSLSSDTSTSTS